MHIHHEPRVNEKYVEDVYSKKDGVPVKYVCTTTLLNCRGLVYDVFYRDTPHPEFGNKYFGITYSGELSYICNADVVEDYEFGFIEYEGRWYYSSHVHDYKQFGDSVIDGGRCYTRGWNITHFKIKDGEFVPDV